MSDIERRPMVALVAPGQKAMRSPELVLDWLVDLPVDAVYLQPLNLNPVRDSFEKLALYVAFATACRDAGLRVIAGRVGAFGLVLQALLGVSAFDSGLGDAEAFALSTQARRRRPRKGNQRGGGRDRRIYFEVLRTTLHNRHATPLLEDRAVRHRLTCDLGCCRYRGFADLADRRRTHYLWTRTAEVSHLRDRPTAVHRTSCKNSSPLPASTHASYAERFLRRRSSRRASSTWTAGWASSRKRSSFDSRPRVDQR
jgi:hypothetical protein